MVLKNNNNNLILQIVIIFFCLNCLGFNKTIVQEPIVTLNTEYSNRFGYIINPRYANLIDFCNALGLEIAFNPREYRMEATWVHQFSSQHRLKTTAEYLSQVIPVMFVTGETEQWTDQGAIAVLYQYRNLHLQSYYVHAHDEHLLSWPYNFQHAYMDHRNIAGSRNIGGGVGINLQPFPATFIGMDLFYDALNFNNVYESAPDSGFGGAICLENIFSDCLRAKISLSERAIYQQFHVDFSWLAMKRPSSDLELVFGFDYFTQPFIIKNESIVALKLVYHWGDHCCLHYDQDNVLWASQPVVRFPQTMVMRDESVELY